MKKTSLCASSSGLQTSHIGWKVTLGIVLAVAAMVAPAWAARPETTIKLDVPGAVVTTASGINGDGAIVGWYCLQACNPTRFRGFIRDPEGVFHDIVVPN